MVCWSLTGHLASREWLRRSCGAPRARSVPTANAASIIAASMVASSMTSNRAMQKVSRLRVEFRVPSGADATACVARVSAARTYASPCTAGAGFRSPPRAGEPGQRRVSARRSRRRPADLDERSLGVVAFDGDAAVAAAHQAVPDSARLLSVEFVERVDVVTVAATASASESSTAPAEAAQATNAPAATVAS